VGFTDPTGQDVMFVGFGGTAGFGGSGKVEGGLVVDLDGKTVGIRICAGLGVGYGAGLFVFRGNLGTGSLRAGFSSSLAAEGSGQAAFGVGVGSSASVGYGGNGTCPIEEKSSNSVGLRAGLGAQISATLKGCINLAWKY
jgi:hypothetical protein